MRARAPGRGADPRIELLLEVLDQAFDQKGWHGTTLRGSLRGVTPDEALWRPAPGRHNIWELSVHAAYWKYAVRRRLAGDAASSFPRKPSNWPEVPAVADARAWKKDIGLLEAEHRLLREAVRTLPTGSTRCGGGWRVTRPAPLPASPATGPRCRIALTPGPGKGILACLKASIGYCVRWCAPCPRPGSRTGRRRECGPTLKRFMGWLPTTSITPARFS